MIYHKTGAGWLNYPSSPVFGGIQQWYFLNDFTLVRWYTWWLVLSLWLLYKWCYEMLLTMQDQWKTISQPKLDLMIQGHLKSQWTSASIVIDPESMQHLYLVILYIYICTMILMFCFYISICTIFWYIYIFFFFHLFRLVMSFIVLVYLYIYIHIICKHVYFWFSLWCRKD